MTTRTVTSSALIAVLIVVAACASPRGGRPPLGTAVTVTPEQSGRAIALGANQELFVRLPSNPATGYRWTFTAAPADVLKLEGSPSLERGNLVGAPGIEVWRFKPTRTGQQTLRFEYRRPWETEGTPAQQLWYAVTIR